MAFRRWFARRKRESHAGHWPIKPGSERPPEGWNGWPNGHRFAFVLTHDVDSQKGLDRVKQLAELEMALGFRSSFNLIPEGPYRVEEGLRHWLTGHGFEVGVHDLNHDGKLYLSEKGFEIRAQRINHYLKEWNAVGFRSGFMHHNLKWLLALDALYDASTFDTDPFEPQPDGVNTIFPFRVRREDRRDGYVELPYTLPQDSTLFVLFKEKTNQIWERKLDWIVERGGMALLNAHPDYMSFDGLGMNDDEFPAALYEKFLRHVKEKYAGSYWHALPREVARFV